MKRTTRLLDLGRASKKTQGMSIILMYEGGLAPYTWWFIW